MIKKKKKENGFTLIEILATIVILGLIFGVVGYYVTNSINSSKEKSEALAIANIKTTARMYVEENPKDVFWASNKENENEDYSCIPVNLLISKGLIKEKVKEEHELPNYIIVNRNNNTYTLYEELDNGNVCQDSGYIAKLPTSNEYCNDLSYDKDVEKFQLTNTTEVTSTEGRMFYFENYFGKNAGNYTITAVLEDNHIWEDGSKEKNILTVL